MKEIHLTDCLPDEQVDALAGTLLDDSAFDLLVQEDTTVYKPNGEPLLIYRKGVLHNEICEAAWRVLRDAATPTDNRGLAGGMVDYAQVRNPNAVAEVNNTRFRERKSDGSLSRQTRANLVNSGVVGFYDRSVRFPYCRLTAFNIDHHQEFIQAMPFVYAVSEVFRENAPFRYAAQMAMVNKTSKDFYISGTVFTTITVNKNFRTAVHKDKGDYREGFGVMAVLQAGEYSGGYLCFPKYRVAVDMRTGGVCMADVHEWHGNTPIVGVEGQYERLSCVFYYRSNMAYCGTADEELQRAKGRQPGQALNDTTFNQE